MNSYNRVCIKQPILGVENCKIYSQYHMIYALMIHYHLYIYLQRVYVYIDTKGPTDAGIALPIKAADYQCEHQSLTLHAHRLSPQNCSICISKRTAYIDCSLTIGDDTVSNALAHLIHIRERAIGSLALLYSLIASSMSLLISILDRGCLHKL